MSKIQQHDSGKILLAVDGSSSAKAAAYAAAQIAPALRWDLHALYVVDVTQVFEIYRDTSQELSEFGEEIPHEQKVALFEEQGALALAEIKALCQERRVSVTTEMLFGGIPEIILKKSQDYNLLAIGRLGNRHLKDPRHFGSNFQQIAHHIHQPLLVGSQGDVPQRKLERALLAYDGSESARKTLAWTEQLQTAFTKVMAISVRKEDERDFSWLEDRHAEIAESVLTHFEFIPQNGEPGSSIVTTALSKHADLVLMGAPHRTRLFRWNNHNVFDTVLRETDLPVLAIT